MECSAACACAATGCGNRVVQRGLAVDLAVVRTAHTGWGVATAAPLRKGQFVVEYAGAVLSEAAATAVDGTNDFLLKVSDEHTLDPTERGGVGAFVNHSCAPNCIMQRVYVEQRSLPRMALFAVTAIPAGAELTWHYGKVRATRLDPHLSACCSSSCGGRWALRYQAFCVKERSDTHCIPCGCDDCARKGPGGGNWFRRPTKTIPELKDERGLADIGPIGVAAAV